MSITSRAARTLAETAQANDGVTVDPATMLDIAEEIERLQAIIDKLPTTEDGVPVYHDQEVWLRIGNRITHAVIVEVRRDNVLCSVRVDMRPMSVSLSQVYSTREAAEAAGGE